MELLELEKQIAEFEQSKRVVVYADEETANRLGIKIGDPYTIFPLPNNKEESFEQLERFSGIKILISCIKGFNCGFTKNLRTLTDELNELNAFIEEAEKISTKVAFSKENVSLKNIHQYEYLRWKYDYYKNDNIEFTSYPSFISTSLMLVYGKYFLYKNWLEEQIYELTPKSLEVNVIEQIKQKLKRDIPIKKKSITIFETIKRELNIIHSIFTSQLLTKEHNVFNPNSQEGRICRIINIRSDIELYKIEDYKQHYVERFESTSKTTVVENELVELYRLAKKNIEYYTANLSDKNPLVQEMYNSINSNNNLSIETINFRTMIVLVVDYLVYSTLFGYNTNSNDVRVQFTNRNYNYEIDNDMLFDICYNIVRFIDNFEIPKLTQGDNENENILIKDNLGVNVITHAEHSEMFESSGEYVGGSESKKKPEIPEKWGALLYLIELAIKNEDLPTNIKGDLSKKEIIEIGKLRGYKTAQYFYNYVRDTNLAKPNAIATEFHKNWKEYIIKFSNNNPEIINFLSEK